VNPGSSSIYFQQNRQLNDKGEDIRSLQKFLNLQGFVVAQNGAGSMGNETSIFGIHTYRALVQFQSAHGLPATGFLGPMTRGTINGQ
jgi:peptidoglycan hydrolase-like protein with peptidoglycan-binding domain